ncbi:MAG: carboxypeptidase regulatory-like domain-containing protein [Myxococcota bacterium]|nr:carboxypeptidase regulatory-like domain-containing protein [Myxococcota bacterium]
MSILASLAVMVAVAASSGCSSKPPADTSAEGGNGCGGLFSCQSADGGTNSGALVPGHFCFPNGACQMSCGGSSTNLVGTVYDPAAKNGTGIANPLYGVVVYVPAEKPGPLPQGASCASCAALYPAHSVTYAITDAKGQFVLKDVPAGPDVPLVVQVGKWRKQYTLKNVVACKDNVPDSVLRLPGNGGEGDLPNIAISTGGLDSLECLLSRIGVDASEYSGGPSGSGHIHIFAGAGSAPAPNTSPAGPLSPTALWTSKDAMMPYDLVLLSCEGGETTNMNQQALYDYANAGGRVFASHFHYSWFDSGPFAPFNLATWKVGSNDIGTVNANIATMTSTGAPFPRGQAMKDWLTDRGALTNGELPIQQARHNADVSAANVKSTVWISADQNAQAPNATEYFSFETPLGGPSSEMLCGRVVYSDLHVGAASNDYGGSIATGVVPSGCGNRALSPQEKALEFMLFDLSGCVAPPNTVPPPPPQ